MAQRDPMIDRRSRKERLTDHDLLDRKLSILDKVLNQFIYNFK